MRISRFLLTGLLLLFAAPSWAEPTPVDVSQYRAELIVLKASKGHYLVTPLEQMRFRTFWGTAEVLHMLRGTGGSSASGPDAYTEVSAFFNDPRLGRGGAIRLEWKAGQWSLACAKRDVALEVASPAETARILEKAKFLSHFWERKPVMLARDEYGTYYYVEENFADKSKENIHVYSGWMGNMVKTRLLLVARDSEGSIFSTRTGDRRLIMDEEMYRWVEDEVVRTLRKIPVEDNWVFIHTTLGVYTDKKFGTPCDTL